MKANTKKESCAMLLDAGISLCISRQDGSVIDLSLEEALFILDGGDMDVIIADDYGVSVTDYKGWVDEKYRVRCSAITKKGTRCTNHAANIKFEVEPEEWAKHKGEYCALHG